MSRSRSALLVICILACACTQVVDTNTEAVEEDFGVAQILGSLPNNFPVPNRTGASATFSTDGDVDLGGEFFANFGTNGRNCGTCHLPTDGWTIKPTTVELLFLVSAGTHPMFRTNDGSNSPVADTSSFTARQAAYSMLRRRGVIRVGIGIPAGAEFELAAVDDPYGWASAGELSLFRRPLPSTNLGFIPAVMWDGRVAAATVRQALADQSNGATLGHAQAAQPLPTETREAIVAFETALATAQILDFSAGTLSRNGGQGGPELLSAEVRANARFDLFDGWAGASGRRGAIARGQELFNTEPNANGGTCRGCHSVSNVGASFNPIFFNVGISAGSRRTPDLPLYTLRNLTTAEEIQTTDPGRALITGRWSDIDRFKAPVLRGVSARAPYFHNGSAASLADVVTFYEQSLGFDFTAAEEADLVAFLSAL